MEQDYDYLFRRRHALHRENREVWERSRAAYYGGEAYIRRALVRHVSEVEPEFEERLRRAYYFNYPRGSSRSSSCRSSRSATGRNRSSSRTSPAPGFAPMRS